MLRCFALAAAALAAAACYKTPKPNCSFSCGQGGACPDDYTCGPDNICHLMSGGGLAACEHPFFDAAAADAKADAEPGAPDAPIDASGPDANLCPVLTVASDSSGKQPIVISLVQPHTGGGQIELYNPTNADVNASAFELVSGANAVAVGATVKRHGYSLVAWPASFGGLDAGGEIVLYDGATHDRANMIDFLCWDTDAVTPSALTDANMNPAKWTGACAAPPSGTPKELARKNNVAGVGAGDYDAAATRDPLTCQAP
jgi:hypothetical protein